MRNQSSGRVVARISPVVAWMFTVVMAGAVAERGTAQERRRENASRETGTVMPAEWVKTLKWRSIGPAGMGGRITAISVFEADPSTWWIATASGGLLKTINNGVTFEHQFDQETTVSIGDVKVAPSNKDVVWVGTGEANPRNSVSYGDGVYKSVDGGKTWKRMGLEKGFQTGGIAIHPTNPDVVYVGLLGRLYGPSEDRGLFKTTDGGKTWAKVLYHDDRTGVIDVAMSPADPETLIVALWDRQRDGFDSHRGTPPVAEGHDGYDPARKWGKGAGLYKTTDGGKNWTKLGNGLPASNFGRCDVDWYRKDPNVVFAIVDCEKIGMGPPPMVGFLGVTGENAEGGALITRVTPKSPAEAAGIKDQDLVVAASNKPVAAYAGLAEAIRAKRPGEELVLSIRRGEEKLDLTVKLELPPLSAAGAGPPPTWIGLTGEGLPDGLRVTEVTEAGPADKAGVKTDDLIKTFDDEAVTSSQQLAELVRVHRPGDSVRLSLDRGGETVVATVALAERPTTAAPGGFGGGGGGGGRGGGGVLTNYFGATVRDQERAGRPEIARLLEDRPAEKAGLQEGDLILECDGTEIKETTALTELIGAKKEGDSIALKVERDSKPVEVSVKLESAAATRLRPFSGLYAGQMPNVQNDQGKDAQEYGGIYRSADAGETWTRINSLNPRPMYFSMLRVDPSDERYLYAGGISLHRSTNGGRTFTSDGGSGVHADHHALWIDPRDGRHMIAGTDGGFYATWDRTRTWEHLNHLALGQFYHVAIDARHPYRVYGGLQDNGSWGGVTRALGGPGILNEDWISVGGGDGFVCRTDPFDPDIVYSESQEGAMGRRNLRTGERGRIAPRPKRGVRYRFNWNTPFILSSHNPGIFYCAGNYVFRSFKRGDDLKPISPEIARTGRGTATALAESPLNADVLWCGTDDGNLWVTKDGGVNWTNVADKLGLPGPRWIATVEPSRFVEGRCYVACDAHRSDDDEPYALVTENFGESWTPIRANLPWGSTRCLREDLKNRDLLYCGTEFAAWASLDRGRHWTKINSNLPTVAIHEFAQHPTGNDVVVATHGRSLWIVDAGPLRQMTSESVEAPAWLYEPTPVVRWRSEPERGTGGGAQRFVAPNPPRGATIAYSLRKKAEKAAIRVVDFTGQTVREIEAKTEPGLHLATWDLSGRPARAGAESRAGRDSASRPAGDSQPASRPASRPGRRPGGGGGPPGGGGAGGPGGQGGPGGFQGRGGRPVPLGSYRVILSVDGKDYEKTLRIEADPTLSADVAAMQGMQSEEQAGEEAEQREKDAEKRRLKGLIRDGEQL
jgi:S1-C subfamily serine protease/photosystem II stability/assembly factor-like uncharacterized protein